jgi:hypothetical protein
MNRLLSIVLCVILLVFGMASEYLFAGFFKENTLISSIIRTGITLILNFFIVGFLEWTTEKVEFY